MKSNDVPIGAGLLVLSLLILWHVSSFPPAPGQPYNAALFPGIAAVGLAFASIALIVTGIRKRGEQRQTVSDAARVEEVETLASSQDVEVLETAKVPSRVLAIGLTAGAIVFYLIAANFLGFIITGTIILAALMWSFGVAFKVLVPVSILSAVVIHLAFYKLLAVPLPWGVLQPLAW
jgi:putative tricarboxylic transport membrane protein